MLTSVIRAIVVFVVGMRVLGRDFDEIPRVKTAAFLSIGVSVLVLIYGYMSRIVPLETTNLTSLALKAAITVCIFVFWASARCAVRSILGCDRKQADRVLARMGVYMAATWSVLHFIAVTTVVR